MPSSPSTLWKRPGARRRPPALKREAVRLAAARLFAERGYHRVSLDDIAGALHVTKPTIYRYVANKEELLFECFRIGLNHSEAAFERVHATEATGLERLSQFIRAYAAGLASDAGRCTIRIQDTELSVPMRARIRRLRRRIDARFRMLVAEGLADGSIAPIDPKMAAFAIAGSLNWIGHWHVTGGELDVDQVADRFVSLFANGLAPRLPYPKRPPRASHHQPGAL